MPSNAPTRRRFLAASGLFVTASIGGCSLAPFPATDGSSRELSLSLDHLDGSLRDRFVLNLTRSGPPWDEVALDAALNGTDYTTQHHRPFPSGRGDEPAYARRNGTYYELDSLVVGEETVTHPVLRLYEVDDPERLDSEPVPASSLPDVDRRAVQVAHMAARARGNTGGVPWGLVERDGAVYRTADPVETSTLVTNAGPAFVEYRETVYEVSVSRETFHEAVYRPDVDPVADSEAEMETILRASLLDGRFHREALSSDARDVLREAMVESYRESHPYSAGFESVLKGLGHWAYLDGNVEKDAGVGTGPREGYLAYDDHYMRYTLRFVSVE